jgi:hypothetical protein
MGNTRFVNRVLAVDVSLRKENTLDKKVGGSKVSSTARTNTMFLHFVSSLSHQHIESLCVRVSAMTTPMNKRTVVSLQHTDVNITELIETYLKKRRVVPCRNSSSSLVRDCSKEKVRSRVLTIEGPVSKLLLSLSAT